MTLLRFLNSYGKEKHASGLCFKGLQKIASLVEGVSYHQPHVGSAVVYLTVSPWVED